MPVFATSKLKLTLWLLRIVMWDCNVKYKAEIIVEGIVQSVKVVESE